jgi:cysteinyl-tRNA synthetase
VTLRLYNTMVRAKEDFAPREEGKVFMYVCGPTVYNHIHIGNARTFLSFDVIRRYLEYRGFDVRFVQNITDVDDKIIKQANEEGLPAADVASRYADAFLKAMADLGVKRPSAQPRATETIPQMISMVERLIERGHAYDIDGDVYFSVRSFDGYGKLSGRDIDELEIGARVAADERKRDPLDFALWKSAKPGEPHWPSPWGEGRPGWHIECSVMSEAELGIPFDIHGGATDLIFPHHENELAQSEAATGRSFVRYWMHGGLLQVNAEKMSKSLGNFMLLKDVLETYPTPVVRLLMLQTHYRSPLEFSTERLDEAAAALERVVNVVRNLHWARTNAAPVGAAPGADHAALAAAVVDARGRFETDMDDDFNTAGALAAVFELSREANTFMAVAQAGLSSEDHALLARAEAEIVELLSVLGVTLPAGTEQDEYPAEVVALARDLAGYAGSDPSDAVDALLAARSVARSEKNWAAADVVRDSLAQLGFVIEDTAGGARVAFRGAV